MDFKKFGTGIFFTLSACLFGFLLGGFLGGRVFGYGMGWDRLADALGGMMLGVLGFAVFAVFIMRYLNNRQRIYGAIAWLLLAIGLFFILKSLPRSQTHPLVSGGGAATGTGTGLGTSRSAAGPHLI